MSVILRVFAYMKLAFLTSMSVILSLKNNDPHKHEWFLTSTPAFCPLEMKGLFALSVVVVVVVVNLALMLVLLIMFLLFLLLWFMLLALFLLPLFACVAVGVLYCHLLLL